MVQIHAPSDAAIRHLAEVLRAGGLVAVPTETVYGLAANGLDAVACQRIFAAKDRPADDPLILHLLEAEQVTRIAHWSEAGQRLADAFWPGPLTLVLEKLEIVPDVVTAGLGSVAVRVPAHPVIRRLLEACDLPLAAPSANPFGYVSPTCVEHVVEGLGGRIEHVLDGGPCEVGLESTIVDLRDPSRPVLLRPGGITAEALEQVLGVSLARASIAQREAGPQTAPGQLSRHYSPRTRIHLHEKLPDELVARPAGVEALLFLTRPSVEEAPTHWRWLSDTGSLEQAASRLFATLRELDRAGFEAIHAELAPQSGLGVALNDRLRRAANQD